MYRMIPAFHKANALSMLGLAFAVGGMFLAFWNARDGAIICLVLAGLCDLFDGRFASRFARPALHRQMGAFIDSFADIVVSVSLPIVVLVTMGGNGLGTYLTAVFYAMMGLHRLAYFHIAKEETGPRHFIGVPVTYIALAVPVVYTIGKVAGLEESLFFQLALHLVYLGMGLAFVWDRPVRKPAEKGYTFFGLLAIAIIGLLTVR